MDATPGAEAPQLDSVVLTPRQTEPGFPLDGVVSRYGESYNLDEVATFAAAITSSDYARNCMTGCAKLPDGESFLRAVALASLAPGLWLEFGVYSGRTLAVIAGARPDIKIYGFDSFEGLPEDWRDAYGRGTFATQALPPTPENGELVVGRFDATLPGFVSAHAGQPVSFIHVDCDLYSSTRVIFEHLRPMLRPGTVIAFDEYFNYPGWQQHEFRAFQEFVREAGIRYEYFAYVPSHQQVAVRIIEVGAGRH